MHASCGRIAGCQVSQRQPSPRPTQLIVCQTGCHAISVVHRSSALAGKHYMPLYIRKTVSAGPFRFNLSKSGIGLSVGVKGLRVGTGPRGHYVHAGRGGLYYRGSLGGSHGARTSVRAPPAAPRPAPGYAEQGRVTMVEVQSGDVAAMRDDTVADLVDDLIPACSNCGRLHRPNRCACAFPRQLWRTNGDSRHRQRCYTSNPTGLGDRCVVRLPQADERTLLQPGRSSRERLQESHGMLRCARRMPWQVAHTLWRCGAGSHDVEAQRRRGSSDQPQNGQPWVQSA
jgi:hypothetical protein